MFQVSLEGLGQSFHLFGKSLDAINGEGQLILELDVLLGWQLLQLLHLHLVVQDLTNPLLIQKSMFLLVILYLFVSLLELVLILPHLDVEL